MGQDGSPTRAPASYVVTGGARGVGRAISRHLAEQAHVVVIDPVSPPEQIHPNVTFVCGDAAEPATARRAARLAETAGPLRGWVNNAAVFRDATLVGATAGDIVDMITANLIMAVTGCHTAVNHFRENRRPGVIVNVSSHQAQRPVRGALPYATAKAAVEGLTRAVAIDHGPEGIRSNAVALGSIRTDRYEEYQQVHPEVDAEMAALHPLGRVGTADEVAAAVSFLLSDASAFINGAILAVDGGRAVNGHDPEGR